jgi:hypothetical protein
MMEPRTWRCDNIPEGQPLRTEKERKGEVGPQNPPCKERYMSIIEERHLDDADWKENEGS